MNTNTKRVTITVREVGQRFGCCAVIRDAKTNRKIAETLTVRPYGYDASAYADGVNLAEDRGWSVASRDDE